MNEDYDFNRQRKRSRLSAEHPTKKLRISIVGMNKPETELIVAVIPDSIISWTVGQESREKKKQGRGMDDTGRVQGDVAINCKVKLTKK